jgi:hypothetical protein
MKILGSTVDLGMTIIFCLVNTAQYDPYVWRVEATFQLYIQCLDLSLQRYRSPANREGLKIMAWEILSFRGSGVQIPPSAL